MGDHPTLTELYLRIAKARALEVVEELIESADSFRFDYGAMREFLEALAFPHRAIPSEEEYRALVDGKVTRTSYPLALSDNTRRLLAAGLRAFADDLEQGVPCSGLAAIQMQEDTLKRFRRQLLGLEPK